MSHAPISPLRRRMIEDMTVRGFGEKTQSDYLAFLGSGRRVPPCRPAALAPIRATPFVTSSASPSIRGG